MFVMNLIFFSCLGSIFLTHDIVIYYLISIWSMNMYLEFFDNLCILVPISNYVKYLYPYPCNLGPWYLIFTWLFIAKVHHLDFSLQMGLILFANSSILRQLCGKLDITYGNSY